ncbi:MAG: PTS fructose IIA subunit family protein [Xanthomonadales bacterium]|nr:PTS fructose IIA subunit family protein [Xanthomonadales bacterium]
MSVAIALVTHPGIGPAMRDRAQEILAHSLDGVTTIELDSGKADPLPRLEEQLAGLDTGDGVLVLTDLPGATPCNQAQRATPAHSVLISGLNLPMLMRAWNYRDRPLEELRDLVMDGGRAAILEPE